MTQSVDVVDKLVETFPGGAPPEDDEDIEEGVLEEGGITWVDVSFDGTWMKRGFTSHYGTGYVLDFEVFSTYCHTCETNKEKLEGMEEVEQEEWMEAHAAECSINHEGSVKAMEKEAAVTLWNRSVQRHGLRYRTMLSDGDSTAFTAVRESQPYGPQRLVTKLECVNHCHKRMGTALRKAATEGRLGGRGVGRLTKDKCSRLQNYYRGAILNNLGPGNQNAMRSSIWASLYHCCSTDDEPQHDYCPDISSWCFYKIAIARGEVPPPYAEHVGTAISSAPRHKANLRKNVQSSTAEEACPWKNPKQQ
ncbi:hypothetical protein ACOMHN_055063 [Nucella lapillus]